MARNPAWSVKGVDDATRAVARAAAMRAGLPIGVWIDRAILRAAAPSVPEANATPSGSRDAAIPDVIPQLPVPARDIAAAAPASAGTASVHASRNGNEFGRPEKSPLDAPPPGEERADTVALPPAVNYRRSDTMRYGLGGAIVVLLVVAGIWLVDRMAAPPVPPSPDAGSATVAAAAPAESPQTAPAKPDLPGPATGSAPAGGERPIAPQETVPALAALTAEASAGDTRAQYELAVQYSLGKDVAKDDRRAAEWFEKAAVRGLAAAQYNLAVLYEQGRGVAQDNKLAFFWYQSAAEQNHPRAQHNLAILYAVGKGIGQNYREARRWFDRAARTGVIESLYSLGLIYEHGLGVERDRDAAMDYYRRAAAAGDADAREKLAREREAKSTMAIAARADGADRKADGLSDIAPAAGTTGDGAAADTRSLTRRETAELQRLLARLDFAPGSADGVAGRRTVAAIRLYQEFAGLPADGKPTRWLLEDVRAVTGSLAKRGAKPVR
jgi:localization factor PodJL